MADIAGSIISAGASLLGGAMNQRAQKAANNVEAWNAVQNREMQYDFARNGITWKVRDAQNAGVSPIYALGAQTNSFSPVSIGTTAATGMGDAISNAGQHLGRAVNATASGPERADAFTKATQQLTLENQALQNQLLASQVRISNQAGMPPTMPTMNTRYMVPGQGNSPQSKLIEDKPLERVTGAPEAPHQEPGSITDLGWSRTKSGFAPIPSKDIADRIDDNIPAQVSHYIRNNIVGGDPPPAPLPPGYDRWGYNFIRQQYEPQKKITKWPLPFDIYW